MPSFQDYDLWIRLARDSRFDFVDRDLVKYYVHAKRIWTNPEALDRGIDLMVEKHGSSRALRRNLCRAEPGCRSPVLLARRDGEGQEGATGEIRLDPASPRPYSNLALSHFGGAIFAVRTKPRRGCSPRAAARARPPSQLPREVGR